jgi:2-dehydro-3-deoxy-D-arabinonate dehydratase
MRLFNTADGPVVEHEGRWHLMKGTPWDELVNRDDLFAFLADAAKAGRKIAGTLGPAAPLAPIGSQEVWAAGVTYLRSRTARMEESATAGGSDFYDRVYHADRPELFLKATPHRVVGPGQPLHLRRDSRWIVPEPELTLVVTRTGKIVGYTIGNDLSCRDIEGENPLYLPQAKTFNACCALGPCVYVSERPLDDATVIQIEVQRKGDVVFAGATDLGQMHKKPPTLVEYLFRDNSFPNGCLLMTGTGVVPPDDFTLRAGDRVRITIEPIGALVNPVE